MITQEWLKDKFYYDKETGLFTRKVSTGNGGRFKSGEVAGSMNICTGYIEIWTNNRLYLAHRLAWLYINGGMPEFGIDHIDGNRFNNRWNNLRLANQSQNMRNMGLAKNNKSGYKGVSFRRDTNKWTVRARFNGEYKSLGCFDSKEEARKAYDDFARLNHGEFYRTAV